MVEPMLCVRKEDNKPFNDPKWIYEIKIDGMRIRSTLKGNLVSRKGVNRTHTFPEIANELYQFLPDAELDGELFCGRGTFKDYIVLKNRLTDDPFKISLFTNPKLKTYLPVYYGVFDITNWQGKDIRHYPLVERKRILYKYARETPHIKIIRGWENGLFLYEVALKTGFEGVVAKKLDSPYISGYNENWLKIKKTDTKDAIIVGVTKKHSLVLAYNGVYVGKAGSFRGYPSGYRHSLAEQLKKYAVNEPVVDLPLSVRKEIEFYTKPVLKAEVEFHTEFENGVFREPVFVRLRND